MLYIQNPVIVDHRLHHPQPNTPDRDCLEHTVDFMGMLASLPDLHNCFNELGAKPLSVGKT